MNIVAVKDARLSKISSFPKGSQGPRTAVEAVQQHNSSPTKEDLLRVCPPSWQPLTCSKHTTSPPSWEIAERLRKVKRHC